MSAAATPQKSGNFIVDYFREFSVLRETRKEYWGIQIINFLDSTMFFAIITMGPLMFSQNFGFSDEAAGLVMTVYGSGTTICLFIFGAFTDWLGIRRSFIVAQLGQLVTRGAVFLLPFVIAGTGALPQAVIWTSFALMAPFVAMVQTTFQAANKRFTTKRSRGAGFNAWYLFMNVGAFAAGFVIDLIRITIKDAFDLDIPPNHFVMGLACIVAVVNIVLTLTFVQREEQLYGPGEKPEPVKEEEPGAPKKNMFTIAADVLKENIFWRFLVLITLLLGVRSVFLHMHLLMPKFWERTIGEDARIGLLQQVNPFLVIIGLILFIPILKKFTTYGMLAWGSLISALSLFIVAIPATGETVYYTSLIALIVLTVGEVIWSPRLTEYTAAIAPQGQEGTYLGLSMVPYFAAKTVVSALSGFMLAWWVPNIEAPTYDAAMEQWKTRGERVEAAGAHGAEAEPEAAMTTDDPNWKRPAEDVTTAPAAHDGEAAAAEKEEEPQVTLRELLEEDAIPFWQSPSAMWVILAIWATTGPVMALLLRGWFTKGAKWDKEDDAPPPSEQPVDEPADPAVAPDPEA